MKTYHEDLKQYLNQDLPWKKMSGKTIMISGATGMIGKCIIDILMTYNHMQNGLHNDTNNKSVTIIALSRNQETAKERFAQYWENENFRYISADVNETIPECGSVDYVIHAASNTHPLQYSQDSIGTITSKVIGTKNLLDYAVAHKTERFCFVSFFEIYGENRGDTDKFSENYLGYID